MPNIKRIMIGGKEVWIEVEGEISEGESLKRVSQSESLAKAVEAGVQLTDTITAYCTTWIKTFMGLDRGQKPETITAEFGLKLSGEGNVYVVKTAGEASLKITTQWKLK